MRLLFTALFFCFLFSSCNPTNNEDTSGYNCTTEGCVQDLANAQYMTLNDCLSVCEEENGDSQNIPFVPVNFDINLNLPAYNDLNFVSNHIYVNGGSKGLIIYRYTQDIFVVLDRHSTSDIELGCIVSVDDDGLLISDHSDCSESKWLIIDGTVAQGPAVLPLHRYNTNWNPPILSIYN